MITSNEQYLEYHKKCCDKMVEIARAKNPTMQDSRKMLLQISE